MIVLCFLLILGTPSDIRYEWSAPLLTSRLLDAALLPLRDSHNRFVLPSSLLDLTLLPGAGASLGAGMGICAPPLTCSDKTTPSPRLPSGTGQLTATFTLSLSSPLPPNSLAHIDVIVARTTAATADRSLIIVARETRALTAGVKNIVFDAFSGALGAPGEDFPTAFRLTVEAGERGGGGGRYGGGVTGSTSVLLKRSNNYGKTGVIRSIAAMTSRATIIASLAATISGLAAGAVAFIALTPNIPLHIQSPSSSSSSLIGKN